MNDTRVAATRTLPWGVARHIPIALGLAASAIIATAFVWPSLSEASRLDERCAELERDARAKSRVDAFIADLTARRDAAQAEIHAVRMPLAEEVARQLAVEPDGTRTLVVEASYEQVASTLAAIDRASGFAVVECHIGRGKSDAIVRLAMRLAVVEVTASEPTSESGEEVQP